MNAIIEIIDKRGGLEALKQAGHFKVRSGGYMPLSINYLGVGPHGLPMVAVAHNYEQNGDMMADPDMEVEIGPGLKGGLDVHPLTYQQDSLGIFQRVYKVDDAGKAVGFRPKLLKELRAFLRTWSSNLRAQGFVKAAKNED